MNVKVAEEPSAPEEPKLARAHDRACPALVSRPSLDTLGVNQEP